jgi:hypothetical protein
MKMPAHELDFIRGVAMVLQGESMKAQAYLTHKGSLGLLREKIVGRLLRENTPDRFRVVTGFIRNGSLRNTSRQCDILVHDSTDDPPLYRFEDFAIVEASCSRAVIEIKSALDKGTFDDILNIYQSVIRVSGAHPVPPVLGFSLNGVGFNSFLKYVSDAISKNALKAKDGARVLNLPECIAVQKGNYIGLRPRNVRPDAPWYYCAIDLNQSQPSTWQPIDGIETGIFIYRYQKLLRSDDAATNEYELYAWFNRLPILDEGKVYIGSDGIKHLGTIPNYFP